MYIDDPFCHFYRCFQHSSVTNDFACTMLTQDSIMHHLRDARADDVDMFGRILITALMGIDEAKGWFLTRGGSL